MKSSAPDAHSMQRRAPQPDKKPASSGGRPVGPCPITCGRRQHPAPISVSVSASPPCRPDAGRGQGAVRPGAAQPRGGALQGGEPQDAERPGEGPQGEAPRDAGPQNAWLHEAPPDAPGARHPPGWSHHAALRACRPGQRPEHPAGARPRAAWPGPWQPVPQRVSPAPALHRASLRPRHRGCGRLPNAGRPDPPLWLGRHPVP